MFLVSGPPAAGKTTFCAALLARFARGVHLPVDDVRSWVVSGMADSVPWTEETERQFQVAEAAVLAVASSYRDAGFAVAVDHCRNPARLDVAFAPLAPHRVLLLPDLATNLARSHSRTNKSFDPRLLDETIAWTNAAYGEDLAEGWVRIDNSRMGVEESVEFALTKTGLKGAL